MKHSFRVTMNIPESVPIGKMISYIEGAIGEYKGCLNPEDPIFDMNFNDLKVQQIRRKR